MLPLRLGTCAPPCQCRGVAAAMVRTSRFLFLRRRGLERNWRPWTAGLSWRPAGHSKKGKRKHYGFCFRPCDGLAMKSRSMAGGLFSSSEIGWGAVRRRIMFSGPIVSTDSCLKGGRLSEVGQWVSFSWASGVAPLSAPLPQLRSTGSRFTCAMRKAAVLAQRMKSCTQRCG